MKLKSFCLAVCLLISLSTLSVAATDARDGRWYLSLNEREREIFVYGYVTCAVYLAKLDIRFDESFYAYSHRLTSYLQEHPDASKESVESLLWKIASPPYSHPVKHIGGEKLGKWGGMDGNDWRNAVEGEQNVLIAGFLECYTKRTKQEQGTFSRPIEYYVAAITKWYGHWINPNDPEDLSQIDPQRADTKVPEVLFQFRDPAKKPATN